MRQITPRALPGSQEDAGRPHAGYAQTSERGTAAADASTDSRAGKMVAAGSDGLLCLPRSAHECACTRGVPTPRLGNLEANALAAQPEIPPDVGQAGKTCRRFAPPWSHPAF